MSTTDEKTAILLAETLAPHQVKALRILFKALGRFERVGFYPGLGMPMIQWMMDNGLAEQGYANKFTGQIGYRLTELGNGVHRALSQRRPKPQPQLTMLKPLIPQADLRIAKPLKK